jgi:hypothetical protein
MDTISIAFTLPWSSPMNRVGVTRNMNFTPSSSALINSSSWKGQLLSRLHYEAPQKSLLHHTILQDQLQPVRNLVFA